MSGVLFAFAFAAPASAQEPPPEAREFYERGQALYEEGRYREAIVELERAYTLDPNGTILVYNIGLIYEKLGEIDHAMAYYRRYLQHDLAADERARVEAVLRRLEGARPQVEEPVGPATARPPDPPPARAPEYGRADTLFWITAGATGAALVAGGIFGALAVGNDAEAEAIVSTSADDLAHREDLADSADGQALVADVAFVGAIVLGATGALLYFLREKEESPPPVGIAPTPGGAMAVVRVQTP